MNYKYFYNEGSSCKLSYSGKRIQINVRFAPSACHVNEASGKKYYQYTAIEEYYSWR